MLILIDPGALTFGNFLANYNPNITGRATGETFPMDKGQFGEATMTDNRVGKSLSNLPRHRLLFC